MNTDLISRSALRNVILNDSKLDGENANWEVNRILVHIEKAPTVEPPFRIVGHYEIKIPQGEWIECTKSGMPLTEYGRMTGEKWYGFKCSQCNFIYKGNALIESPYCQKCGADMRKGGAE